MEEGVSNAHCSWVLHSATAMISSATSCRPYGADGGFNDILEMYCFDQPDYSIGRL